MDTEGGMIGDIPHVGATSGPVDEEELKQPDRSGHEQGYRLPGRDRPQPPPGKSEQQDGRRQFGADTSPRHALACPEGGEQVRAPRGGE